MQLRAKKSLGQNFLRDSNVIERIVGALNLTSSDAVVEIGPGLGALTEGLVKKSGRVIAIEFDRDMVAHLEHTFSRFDNFHLIQTDALTVNFADIFAKPVHSGRVKLVANLPYNISTPILQRLSLQRHLFSEFVLMFQREVVERITAKPGARGRGFLSVLIENAFDTEYLFDVPPTAFNPVPKVWSSVVRLIPKDSSVKNEILFRDLLSRSFAQKRKTILNNLKAAYVDSAELLEAAGIDGRRRAETLTLAEWVTLTAEIDKRRKASPGATPPLH
ncbi:MAG: 16S rRNA (adenine(1518)-N(6)/adenine(1519)-N(6))-dimethyltransferase RsmA [Pyrinomonadaceae bacterium]